MGHDRPDEASVRGADSLRVGLLTTSYPLSAADTAGLFVQGFAETLARSGHHVRVVAPAVGGHTAPSSTHTSDGDGDSAPRVPVRVERLRYAYPSALQRTFHRAGAPENLRTDPLAALGALTYPAVLAAYVATRLRDVDVLVSHWAVPSGYAATLPRRRDSLVERRPRRVVVTHGADVHLLTRMPLGGVVARRIARESDALTFVSSEHQRRFEALVGEPLPHASVLAMGVPTLPQRNAQNREDARRRLGLRGTVVLTMGRLVPIKGLDVLLTALRGLPDVTLVVAGEGPEREALERVAARCGVRVVFPGVVLGAEKAALLHAADVFALPSRRLASGREEGTPTALQEAMQVGLPVVATDTGGVRELLAGGQLGALVPPDDAPALHAALTELLLSPDAAATRSTRALEAARAQTWESLAPRLDALVRGR